MRDRGRHALKVHSSAGSHEADNEAEEESAHAEADSDEEEAEAAEVVFATVGGGEEAADESEQDVAVLDGDTRIEPDGGDTGARRSISTERACMGA